MTREKFMNRSNLIRAGLRALQRSAALVLISTLAACTSGGPATTQIQQTTPGTTTASYNGPAAANADVQSFKVNLWENIRTADRCGGCHHEGGQSPMFARSDDVNLAYQAANPLVNFQTPAQSTLVLQVKSGHNCWVADPSVCADTMLQWITAWIGAGSASSTAITLTPPPSQTVGSGKQFPADSTQFQTLIWTPILSKFCSNCHRSDATVPQQPYFASTDPNEAYAAAQSKIDLNTPANSRFVVRLGTEFHNCWATTPGGSADCKGSAAAMLAAITAYAKLIPITPVDPSLVLSKALTLTQGTISSGGSRYEANLVAKYEFKTGTGSTAYDTSGVDPEADLQFTGDVSWVGGWGINVNTGGKAQASTASSAKLASMIQSTGEYSIEAWAAPANVAQMNAYIVSYSGSDTTRNATLGQHMMQYEGYARSDQTSANGTPPLQTAAANANAQAALQHIVLTYDPVNGQKLYVNGVFTGDLDPSKGGSLASWDNTFALVLGNETTGDKQWLGVIKFAAIHSRALTAAQVAQNFAAGVGEQYALLFDVTALTGVPQSYIMMTASQYDSYSYLFTNPTFISLNPNAVPASIPVKGMRLGINGAEAPAGQSYATLNATIAAPAYKAASGQALSKVGAVIASALGPTSDMFFLSFDQIGTSTHVHTDPTPAVPTPVTSPAAPDVGVRTFQEANVSMAAITGVPVSNTAVATTYNTLQQSLPPAPQLDAFLSSQQTAYSQLAVSYCTTAVNTPALLSALFPGLDLTQPAATYFGTTTPNSTNRNLIIGPLVTRAIGSGVSPMTTTAVTNELNALITKLVSGSNGNLAGRTAVVAQSACSAVLGSAAVSVQ
jgi:hypothetical protein